MVNKSTQQRIQVYARCRPLNSSEKKQNGFSIVNTKCEKNEIVVKEKPIDKFSKTFTFDKVFGPNSAQVDVYRNVVMPLIEEVLMGYNCTVFAYGQTGTGKTYTMEGEKSDSNLSWEDDPHAGIIPRTLNQIFEQLKKQNIEFTIRVSFLELYNEELFDLLAPANDTSKLRLYEDSSRKGSVVIQGLEEITVHNKDEVYSILERGALKRQTASTLMNANSSRSHSVFTVTVHIKENTDDGEELVKTGKLNLVDLAGSENIGRSGAIDKRAREAGNINQSLLTLGRVITSLVERAPHIPYRESKLTRLLQDSLGGKTKTSIIATVSPASMNLEETLSTLDYAHRAKNITNKPEINQKLTKRALIKQYTEEIERLRKDLFASREKNGFFIDEENYKELLGTIESQSEEMKTQIDQIEKLEAEATKIQKLFEETSVHLSEEKGIREKTEMELSETQRNLHETKDVLKVTITDRDEQRYIVGHHVKTEEVLTSQAKQLKSVTKQTTNEIGLLHEKIDRTTSVDAHNSKVKKNFRSHYQEQLLNMEDSVNLFQKGFNQFCDAHHSDLQLKSQALGSQFLSIKAFLADSKHQQDQLLTDLNLVKSKKRDEMLNCVSEHVETTNDFKHQSVEKVERFLNEDWDMCYKSMAGLLFQQSNIFNEMHERFSQYINSTQGYVENYVTNTRSNLSCLKTSFDQLLKHHDKSQNDVNDELKKLSDHQEVMAAKIQEDIMSNLKSALSGCFVNFKKQTDGHFEQVNESMKMCRTNIHSEQEQINSVIGKEQSSANEWLDSLSKDASTVLEDIGKYHKEVESASSDFSQGLKTFDEVASQFSSETITLNNNMCDKTKECFDKMCLRESCFAEREAALSQDLNNKVDELKNHVEDGLNSAENDDQEKNIEYLEELKAHKEFSEKWKNEMIHALHLRDQDIDRLLNEELEVNIVTGQTPKRREYCYPNSLAATSPHDRILKRFRQRTNVNLGAVVPLPMESSDEADQNISTDKESDVFSSSILSGRGYSSDSDNSKENSFTIPSKLPRSKLHSSLNSLNDSKQKRNAHRQPLGPRQEV